jgi:hypothetical protein
LTDWFAKTGGNDASLRAAVAQTCDLVVVRSKCPAFQRFSGDLHSAATAVRA